MLIPTSAVAAATTVEVTLAVLFGVYGSCVALPTLGDAVMVVPAVAPALTFTVIAGNASVTPELRATTRVKFDVAPLASVGVVQVTTPVPPTAGVMHVQPGGTEIDWNVVLAGIGAM